MNYSSTNYNSKFQFRELLGLSLVLLFAAAVRWLYLFNHPMESRDGILYIQFIKDWFMYGDKAISEFLQTQPPLFSYLSRALMFCGLSAECGSLTVNFVSGILLIIPVYFTGRLVFGGKTPGICLALLAAVMPELVRFSCIRLREGLYLFFLFTSFNFLLHAIYGKKELLASFFCGASATIALLSRYESLEMLLFCGLGIVSCRFFPKVEWKRIALISLFFLAGIAVGVVVIKTLPGMPDIIAIFINRIKVKWLGTSLNPIS